MIRSFIAMYERGAITADHLAAQSLLAIDPADPAPVLEALPDEVVTRVFDFSLRFQTGRMSSNYGPSPASDQVEAARRWIERASKVKPAAASKA